VFVAPLLSLLYVGWGGGMEGRVLYSRSDLQHRPRRLHQSSRPHGTCGPPANTPSRSTYVITDPEDNMSTADPISPALKTVLHRMKLSPILDTLPERLTLARQKMAHQDFLLLVL
jgi:hypothetical protein